MNDDRFDRILDDWAAIAATARRPAAAPRRGAVPGAVMIRSGLSALAGAGLVVALVVLAVVWLNRPGGPPIGGLTPSDSAAPTATAAPTETASPSPSPSPSPTPTASPTPTPTPKPTIGPCPTADLAARIMSWSGAAGHRIATVDLTVSGTSSCHLPSHAAPVLIDGRGAALMTGSAAPGGTTLTVAPGTVLTTLVDTANYCGPDPVAPVTFLFTFVGVGQVTAAPLSATDATVPPCNSAPGTPGDIAMLAWTKR